MKAIVSYGGEQKDPGVLYLEPGSSLKTGIGEFEKHFGDSTSLERDLLVLASAIFAVDIAAKRGQREEIVRSIELTVPLANYASLKSLAMSLEAILHLLSHDNWSLRFTPLKEEPEHSKDWKQGDGVSLLFSGGLDSFAAAVDLILSEGADKVLLASHVTGNPATIGSQKRLHKYLEETFKQKIQRVVLPTGGKNTDEQILAADGPEVTQRTRSFMFLTIAALSARRSAINRVVMIAENGQMAIHVPLSRARLGAFSTHTAHPAFVALVGDFFSSALQFPIHIDDPYLYKTKAEVVARLAANYADAISDSVSCWKSSRVATGHCGECIPCYIRRIALEYHDLETKGWSRDMFKEDITKLPATDEGKRNLVELAMFAADFRSLSDSELDINYCELYNEHFDRNEATKMYRRFAEELKAVFSRYPTLAALIT